MEKKLILKIIYTLVIGIPLLFALRDIFSGSIPFWYDPARDLLLALENIKKITLIGPTTGIPNVFYGPYWIWLLSLALMISHDPRIITLLALTIPYFAGTPLVLFALRKRVRNFPVIGVWLLFILAFPIYATQLWNPNLAPLLFFLFAFLITAVTVKEVNRKTIFLSVVTGLTGGILANFHLSFGIGMLFASVIFMLVRLVLQRSLRSLVIFVSFCAGIAIAFLPFFLFEVRHGFNQIHALIFTFTNSFFYHSAVVGQVGLNTGQIVDHFIGPFSSLLQLPQGVALGISIFLVAGYLIKFKFDYSFKVVSFLLLTLLFVGAIYLSSKNPVWNYHFIAVDAVVVLLLGTLASRHKITSVIFSAYALYLLTRSLWAFPAAFSQNTLSFPSLAAKEAITTSIYKDAGDKPFSVAVYSSAIYTFDYDYLFQWKKDSFPKSQLHSSEQPTVYVVIPETTKNIRDDFVTYKTPNLKFTTEKSTLFPDGTEVIKRRALETPAGQ